MSYVSIHLSTTEYFLYSEPGTSQIKISDSKVKDLIEKLISEKTSQIEKLYEGKIAALKNGIDNLKQESISASMILFRCPWIQRENLFIFDYLIYFLRKIALHETVTFDLERSRFSPNTLTVWKRFWLCKWNFLTTDSYNMQEFACHYIVNI